MSLHALIDDYVIVDIKDLIDEDIFAESRCHQMVLDITGIIPAPLVGWIFDGYGFVSSREPLSANEIVVLQQRTQREFGQVLVIKAVDALGVRNLELYNAGTVVNIASIAQQMLSMRILLESGALKTCVGLCNAIKASYPQYIDIFDMVIKETTDFLNANNY